MKTFKLINKDTVFDKGRTVMVEEAECLAQRLGNAIKLDRGSWFLDIDKGVEWLDILGNKPVSVRLLYFRINNILKNDSEVTTVNLIDISIDRENRKLLIEFSVNSIYGQVEGVQWIIE